MKNFYLFAFLIVFISACGSDFNSREIEKIKLKYDQNITLTYDETIEYYKILDKNFAEAKLFEVGKTDIGKPLHLFVISEDSDFDPVSVHKKNKTVVFINNGIHPGEPCGVDASVQFAKDILLNKDAKKSLLKNTVICIVPIYSTGGTLNRSKYNRANQNTPLESGFRGNAKNLDLNRDFVKLDSENAKSFTKIFRKWNPQVFLDTHTTNGSDHQYFITLIAQNPASMNPNVGAYFKNKMLPSLYDEMKKGEYELIPYIASLGRTPDEKGIFDYIPSPRFSTGYTNLFNNFCFMTENHIFKEFKDRVKSVYNFIDILVKYSSQHSEEINKIIKTAEEETINQKEFTINWKLDKSKHTLINFKGYTGKFKKSKLTGLDRFYYDRNDKFEKQIKYFSFYSDGLKIKTPKFYVVPQAWKKVIKRLELNNVKFHKLEKDSLINVEVYYITDLKTSPRPYNGHFMHSFVETKTDTQKIQYYKGDILIPTNQETNKYIVNVLEPKAPDSFFRWNFFDSCLDQREYFSSYVFEEKAIEILNSNGELKKQFELKRKNDTEFRNNHRAQLNFIYKNSPFYEKSHKRYPVGRVL